MIILYREELLRRCRYSVNFVRNRVSLLFTNLLGRRVVLWVMNSPYGMLRALGSQLPHCPLRFATSARELELGNSLLTFIPISNSWAASGSWSNLAKLGTSTIDFPCCEWVRGMVSTRVRCTYPNGRKAGTSAPWGTSSKKDRPFAWRGSYKTVLLCPI